MFKSPPTPSKLTVGIDVGKNILTVCTGQETPTFELDLKDPTWAQQLAEHLVPLTTVALEPTGWHYSAPVVALIQHCGARVLIVEHSATARVRELHVAHNHKTDSTDARALWFIAHQESVGSPVLGTRWANPDLESSAAALRLLVLAHQRANKECTRATNRLHQVAHAIWPSLGQKLSTYLRAINAGHVTPKSLHELAALFDRRLYPVDYQDGRSRAPLKKLVATVPTWRQADELINVIQAEAWALNYNAGRAADLAELISRAVQSEPFARLTALWQTVPGAGLLDIAAVQGATHGQAAHMTPAQMRACCGCHPVVAQSGDVLESKLTAQGFKPARGALHLWVMRLIGQADNPVAAYFEKKKARGEKYAMAAARVKLVNILSGIARSGTPYIYAVPGQPSDWLLPDAAHSEED